MDPDPLPSDLLSLPIIIGSINAPFILIFLLLILLACSALISASEVAYFSLSPQDIKSLEKEDSKTSKRIISLKQKPRFLLATILISNNFINIAIIILSETLLTNLLGDIIFERWALWLKSVLPFEWISTALLSSGLSFAITVVAVTFLLVLFGEVAPKIYANMNNIKHSKLMSTPLVFLQKLFYPFSALLLSWTGGIEERVYRQRLSSNNSTDKKELDKAIELTVTDQLDREEVDILKGIINFGDVEAKQIMRSRVDVIAIDRRQGFKEVISLIKSSGYSRFPVYEEDLDNLLGILYVKDLLGHTKEDDNFDWNEFVRDNVLYVPETKKIDALLKEFQLKRTHMAVVVDEYGGSAGLVTLEDIMEEVVGEIRDEFDQDDNIDYIKLDDHNYMFEGKTLLNDIVRILNFDNDFFDEGKGSADSIAGMMLELEGVIPKKEKEITYKNITLIPKKVSKRRIERIQICL